MTAHGGSVRVVSNHKQNPGPWPLDRPTDRRGGVDIGTAGVRDPRCIAMSEHATDARAASFEVAERRLFDACAIQVASRRVRT